MNNVLINNIQVYAYGFIARLYNESGVSIRWCIIITTTDEFVLFSDFQDDVKSFS
jgi:hypothetical protein